MKRLTIILCLFASLGAKAQVSTLTSVSEAQDFAGNVLNHATNKYNVVKVDSTNTTLAYYYESVENKALSVKFSKFKNTYKPNWITGNFTDLFGFWKANIQSDADMESIEKSAGTFKKINIDANKYWQVSFYKAGKNWVIKIVDY